MMSTPFLMMTKQWMRVMLLMFRNQSTPEPTRTLMRGEIGSFPIETVTAEKANVICSLAPQRHRIAPGDKTLERTRKTDNLVSWASCPQSFCQKLSLATSVPKPVFTKIGNWENPTLQNIAGEICEQTSQWTHQRLPDNKCYVSSISYQIFCYLIVLILNALVHNPISILGGKDNNRYSYFVTNFNLKRIAQNIL